MAKKSKIAKTKRNNLRSKFSTRRKNRCLLCGRSRAYLRQYGLCRICFREKASRGEIPGVFKASW